MKQIISIVLALISVQSFAYYNPNYESSMRDFESGRQEARQNFDNIMHGR